MFNQKTKQEDDEYKARTFQSYRWHWQKRHFDRRVFLYWDICSEWVIVETIFHQSSSISYENTPLTTIE